MTIPEQAVLAATAIIRAHDTEQWGEDGGDEIYEYLVTRMLTAAAPHLAAVRVKKLEWHGPDYEDEYWASWLGGRYTIQANTDDGRWLGGVGGNFQSVDAAKAAAQADYEPRILSALEPSAGKAAVLEEAAIFEALEECETYFENRSDADHDETGFVPNEEMRILVSVRAAIRALSSHPVADKPDEAGAQGEGIERKFQLGDRVTKNKGSSWTGRVVGFYSTELTPTGYAVESETEIGSVQIYPEAALCLVPTPPSSEVA